MPRMACFVNSGAVLADAVAMAARADTLGYDSVWTTHGMGRDALLVLAAYGAAAPRLGLGTGVIPIYPRHPVLLAQEALTLADVSGGRLRLGIGVSHAPMMVQSLGLDMGRPLDVMRELMSKGAEVSYHDPHVPELDLDGRTLKSADLTDELIADADLVLIVTDHAEVDLERVVAKAARIFDTRNATKRVREGREKIRRL